ncbi:Glutamine amidotransferase type 1 domain protein [Acididesulfobacillus acetoxydans]|uniref:Glutamine amidotransferase class-I n=1 Tax=Acididesulfobacillus acetoxydans TaxID=1561005 RepID=A0A8S0WXM1_9FIRM|nr:gamma-glutamyl-gamma-aminobutyrate hydrolase family protein [Acididesulfobacillus acetoxydans]CAA7601041.1 Glutamine amidotransferase type 1 domain protein [Acididesulfobacillus acetoxydans]CEJ06915.1 Glutamine amidotransferase class-I [Acididesulfobacillus acetoxydans]
MLLIINNYVTNADLGLREMQALGETCRELAGIEYKVLHFSELGGDVTAALPSLQAVISGGYRDSYESFDLDIFGSEFELTCALRVPFLGICGGHQHLALAYGGSVRRCYYGNEEKGFTSVGVIKQSRLTDGLPEEFPVFQYHNCEIAELPPGFEVLMQSQKCRIQAVKLKGKEVYGVQFHPERFDAEHSAGRTILANFFRLLT